MATNATWPETFHIIFILELRTAIQPDIEAIPVETWPGV
jgi:hypothetical protein